MSWPNLIVVGEWPKYYFKKLFSSLGSSPEQWSNDFIHHRINATKTLLIGKITSISFPCCLQFCVLQQLEHEIIDFFLKAVSQWWRSQVLLSSVTTLHQHWCDSEVSGAHFVSLTHSSSCCRCLWFMSLVSDICWWLLLFDSEDVCSSVGPSIQGQALSPSPSSTGLCWLINSEPPCLMQCGSGWPVHCRQASSLSGAHAKFNSPRHQASAVWVKGYSDTCWTVVVLDSPPTGGPAWIHMVI